MRPASIVIAVVLSALALVFGCNCDHGVLESGGAYAVSPDGQWLAAISDGHSEINDKPYAVVCLWDLKRYPSLAQDIRSTDGRHPEVKLEFPQDFHARDSTCEVTWSESSKSFAIAYELTANGSNQPTARVIRYDLVANRFSME